MASHRIESDSLGPVKIPDDKLYGPQTQRCLDNFVIGDAQLERMPVQVVKCLGLLKQACALTNGENGRISEDVANAIVNASKEVAEGKLMDHFPLRVWQTGSGTQSNMNANEVIARRATELLCNSTKTVVHPNDMVNCGQSSNDVFPSVMHISLSLELDRELIPSLKSFISILDKKATEYKDIVKIGRTHLMDAVPLTLGNEFSAYAEGLRQSLKLLEGDVSTHIHQIAQGGTAVGTGLNTFVGFDTAVCKHLTELACPTVPFTPHPNKFAALSIKNAAADLSSALTTLATTLYKIACDIRLLASGPRCGLAELNLPPNEPGSSIMPGKVNPTQCEAMTMVCAQVIGNNQTVVFAASQGHLQLNVMKPVITANVLRSMSLLSGAMQCFRTKCLEGLTPNTTIIEGYLNKSLMLVTCLAPKIGYDKSAKCALKAHETGKTLKDVVVDENKLLTSKEFDEWVDASKMLAPKQL